MMWLKSVLFICVGLVGMASSFGKSQPVESRETVSRLMNLTTLSCSVPFGENLPMEQRSKKTILHLNVEILERDLSPKMPHSLAWVSGCDFPVVDELVQKSVLSFGHAEAEVTLVRQTWEPELRKGQCFGSFSEHIQVDFGNGVILRTDEVGRVQEVSGCEE